MRITTSPRLQLRIGWAVIAVSALALAMAVIAAGSPTRESGGSSGTVTLGVPAVLSGPLAEIGTGAARGIALAVHDLNDSGGVLGKKVQVVIRDDQAKPATAISLATDMIQSDHAVAILGASTSGAGAAEEQLATQYKVPLFLWGGNDESLTAKKNPYTFQLEPTTYMEPLGFAQYMSRLQYKRYYFLAYDYSFGHNSVSRFKDAMAALGHPITDVGERYVPLFTSDYSSIITAASASGADIIFMGIFGGDQLSFLKQAQNYNLFKQMAGFGPSGTDTLVALKGQTPPGLLLADRAYFPSLGKSGAAFAKRYRARFHESPTEWALLGYSAVQTWSAGVKKVGSFNGTQVSTALSGATVHTVRGNFTIRSCDNQATVGETYGSVAKAVNSGYGFPALEHVFVSKPSSTLPPCP